MQEAPALLANRLRSACDVWSKNLAQLPKTLDRMSAMEAAIATHVSQQPADDPTLRDAQRARLSQLHDELLAEGADGSKHLPELQRRADTWPE
jgi:hypothetical protein